MSSDIIDVISSEGSAAVDQIIEDSKRLHVVVNGTGVESASTEDGSLIPSVRKALVDNLYFKSPPMPWVVGGSVTVFNQLYTFTDANGVTEWWYAPGATNGAPVTMQSSPVNDSRFRLFLNGSNITYIYAPLNSPDFTGNPRVPTPSDQDASTSIANTQWVADRIEDLKGQIDGGLTGNFENITISDTATVKTLHVEEESKFDGPIDASETTMSLNKLRMVGQDAEISFDERGTPPAGITTPTHIEPYAIETGDLQSDTASFDKLTVTGVLDDTTVSTDLQGNIQADYVHITGNPSSPAGRPQLIVDGIAKFGSIIADNIQANVDGLDIRPNSVTTDEGVTVGTNLTVGGDSSLGGTTTLQNVVIQGTVSGLSLDVTGQDINPNSVTTDADVVVGRNLEVTGQTTLGNVVADSLSVSGTTDLGVTNTDTLNTGNLTASGDTDLAKLRARRIELAPRNLTGTDVTETVTLPSDVNVVNIVLNKNVTISDMDTSTMGAFTMNVYLRQDDIGNRAVTLGSGYLVLNPDVSISTVPSSVTILQMSYSGFTDDKVDVAIFVRP